MTQTPFDDITSIPTATDKPLETYLITPKDGANFTDADFATLRQQVGRDSAGYVGAGEMSWGATIGSITDPATGTERKGILIEATKEVANDIAFIFSQFHNDREIVNDKNEPVAAPTFQEQEAARRTRNEAENRGRHA